MHHQLPITEQSISGRYRRVWCQKRSSFCGARRTIANNRPLLDFRWYGFQSAPIRGVLRCESVTWRGFFAEFVEDAPSPSLTAVVSDTVPKKHQDDLLIVGIGASAGGLAAFKLFFSRLPPVPGMAFVLIQHLDPSRPSMLVELLRSKLALPIEEAKDGTVIAANHVYAIPPDATLTVSGGILHVTQPAPPRQTRRPIDTFFTSLAQDQGNKAVAIVLSGVGSDGTSGVMAIKEHGGLTLAQREPGDGPLPGMPKSAANSGHVDHVMLVEEMPDWLLGHRRHVIETPHAAGDVENQPDLSERIKRIAAILHAHTGHDFAGYKTATLVRRIERRMQVLQVETMNGNACNPKSFQSCWR